MLQNEVVALVNRVTLKDKELRDLLAEVNDCAYDCSASLDFNLMEAFSIERIPVNKDSLPYTVIGYVIQDENGADVVKEWKIYCSPELHEMLVQDFNKAKADRVYEN